MTFSGPRVALGPSGELGKTIKKAKMAANDASFRNPISAQECRRFATPNPPFSRADVHIITESPPSVNLSPTSGGDLRRPPFLVYIRTITAKFTVHTPLSDLCRRWLSLRYQHGAYVSQGLLYLLT